MKTKPKLRARKLWANAQSLHDELNQFRAALAAIGVLPRQRKGGRK